MGNKKLALFSILLILVALPLIGCASKQSGAQVQTRETVGTSLIVIDSSGNALPIVFSYSREVNGVKYYVDDGKALTKEEILSSLKAQAMTVAEVRGIWGISIVDVFALFTPAQLYGRNIRGAATNAALLYDMWECLTTGPPEMREDPRGILEGLVPDEVMRPVVFDFLEQHKLTSPFSY